MFLKRFSAQFEGEGGIRELAAIAFPMFVSQAADTLMMFVDRLFLARLGKAEIAAAMGGGMTCFMLLTFFLGIIGYSNALVAQYLGGGRKNRCGAATAQGLFLAVLSYPLVLLLAPGGLWLLRASGHDPRQLALETVYFQVLVLFAFLPLLRSAFGSYFSGIGRTRIVMIANAIALLVNVGANYVLIFGKFGAPALGIRGAAYGTVIGSTVGVVILAMTYFSRDNRREFGTWHALRPNLDVARRLLRFGLPSGTEFFLNMAAFNLFVQMMYSYGPDVAAAMTITFNWDMVAFLPVIGVGVGATSLVGRYMGAGKPSTADRAAYSGIKTALGYTLAVLVFFVFAPHLLVGMFTPHRPGLDYSVAAPMAVFMIRMASLYLVSDALMLVFGGALRGAGDTRWVMRASVACHWLLASVAWLQIKKLHQSPKTVWIVFVTMVAMMGLVFFLRFRGGKWKSLKVIEEAPPGPPGGIVPETVLRDFPEA